MNQAEMKGVIHQGYLDTGHKPPELIITVESPPVGVMLAPILAHTPKLNERAIAKAIRTAKTFAYGKPHHSLVDRWRFALSHDNKAGRGANVNQPGKIIYMPYVLAPVFPENGITTGVTEYSRGRIHNLFGQRVRYHPMQYPHFPKKDQATFAWSNKRFCVVSDYPTHQVRDNNRLLHSTTDFAVKYSDGWGIHCVAGVRVPSRFFDKPDTLTVKEINKTRNVEVKRALIELMGYDRYITESKAGLVDYDFDQDARERKLWNIPHDRWNNIRVLEVFNSTPEPDGTHKRYFLPVARDILTCRHAYQWMIDDTPPLWSSRGPIEFDEYEMGLET